MNDIKEKTKNGLKWSSITEIVAKLILPITNMILARVLAPEEFGIAALATMVITFADMFTEAGFQKFIIQRDFADDDELNQYANVAFISNISVSLLLWIIIIIFSSEIAAFVGNPGLGFFISVSCAKLPLTSFTSIQMALYKRKFDFKTLFIRRLIGIFTPLIVTVPLAMLGFSYWSIIMGQIVGELINAIILTVFSQWKPCLYFSLKKLKSMISFSFWTFMEQFAVWLTGWVDVFIIGAFATATEIGLYRTSLQMINAIFSLITSVTFPVLFSALSRLKNNDDEFKSYALSFQRVVALFVVPLGFGIYIFDDFITYVLLGSQWSAAAPILGLRSLSRVATTLLTHYCGEMIRAKGKPFITMLLQWGLVIVLVPTCYYTIQISFMHMVYGTAIIMVIISIVNTLVIARVVKGVIIKLYLNIIKPVVLSVFMCCLAIALQGISNSFIWDFVSILLCMCFYLFLLCLFSKKDILFLKNQLRK